MAAQINQLGSTPILKQTVKNYGVTDIPAGRAVMQDVANPPGGSGANPVGVILTTGGTVEVFGFSTTTIPAGKFGEVMLMGKAVVTCSAAIAQGAPLMVDAAGKVLTWTTTNVPVGRAHSVTSATGEDCLVLIHPAGVVTSTT